MYKSKKITCDFGNWDAKYRENFEVILKNIKNDFKSIGFNGNVSTHTFRSFGAVIRGYLGVDAQKHLRHTSESMTKLYRRGKEWQMNTVANENSDKVAKLLLQ